jgi:CBS domain-containing protein
MIVRDVLKSKGRRVIHISPTASVQEALGLLVEHNIGSLPVLDEAGRLVGIFTERDVLFGVHDDCESFHRKRIADVMTPDPVTCSPDDIVHDVMGKMSQYRVGQLPVMSEGRLVGVVSVGDLIKSMYERVEAENQHLLAYLYGPV